MSFWLLLSDTDIKSLPAPQTFKSIAEQAMQILRHVDLCDKDARTLGGHSTFAANTFTGTLYLALCTWPSQKDKRSKIILRACSLSHACNFSASFTSASCLGTMNDPLRTFVCADNLSAGFGGAIRLGSYQGGCPKTVINGNNFVVRLGFSCDRPVHLCSDCLMTCNCDERVCFVQSIAAPCLMAMLWQCPTCCCCTFLFEARAEFTVL